MSKRQDLPSGIGQKPWRTMREKDGGPQWTGAENGKHRASLEWLGGCQLEDMPGSRSYGLRWKLAAASAVWVGCQEVRRVIQRQGGTLILNITWRSFIMWVGRKGGVTGREVTCKDVLVILEGGSELGHNLCWDREEVADSMLTVVFALKLSSLRRSWLYWDLVLLNKDWTGTNWCYQGLASQTELS